MKNLMMDYSLCLISLLTEKKLVLGKESKKIAEQSACKNALS